MVKETTRFGGKPFHSDLPHFKDVVPDKNWRVSRIVLTHGDVVDSISMTIKNDMTGETKNFDKHGRGGGRKAVIDIPEDDCITGVTTWSNAYIEKL